MKYIRITLLIATLTAIGLFLENKPMPLSAAVARPNIVVIMTDDQNVDSLPVMRKLMAFAEGSWVNFTNAFTNDAKCCPSRSTFLTGQYSHNHGVTANSRGDTLDDSNTLAVWLDQAGYRTGLIGKYLIGFPWNKGTNYQPPGWDYFQRKGNVGNVDTLTSLAVDFINNSSTPFFLYMPYWAPHHIAEPPPRYADTTVYIPPDPPSFNEANVSDKPMWVRNLPLLSQNEIDMWRSERINSQRELLAVDDGVQSVIDALKAKGQLNNTMIIFVGDNGFSWGAHRWLYKNCPYEECSKVPLLIRYPSLSGNREETRLVSNVDLAATIAEYAGVTPGLPQDGRSLVPIITNPATAWDEAVLLERQAGSTAERFYGIRIPGWMYAEYENGDKELYDLSADPYELQNRANQSGYQTIQTELAQQLAALRAGAPRPTPSPTPVVPTPTVSPTSGSPTSIPTETPPSATYIPTPESPTSTPTEAPLATDTPTLPPPPPGNTLLYISSTSGGQVGGVQFADEDILVHDLQTNAWSLYFDGSDVGLGSVDVDAFHRLDDDSLLLSLSNEFSVTGVGLVDDSDIVRFVPASLGASTAGSFVLFFDGSDVGLTTNGEDVDAVSMTQDGRLLISVVGSFSAGGITGNDEDLLAFTSSSLGANTAGAWSLYFDGSDVDLTTSEEDIGGVALDPTMNLIYLSTNGGFSVSGVSGDGSDVFTCQPASLGDNTACQFALYWSGSAHGFGSEQIDAFDLSKN